jgi:hypothetical protein
MATLTATFAQPNGFVLMVEGMFRDMFHAKADRAVAAVAARVQRLPREVGEKMMLDLQR